MIKISILIPIYNTEKYLKKCLDSVIKQTLNEIEIICLNDGSTDSSPQIIDDFAGKDKRIRVVHKVNTGYGHTMNVGLSLAQGEYIGVVESDDYITENMFKKLYEAASEDSCDVSKSNYFLHYESKIVNHNIFKNMNCDVVSSARENPQLFYMTPCIWSAIYKREFLHENEILFNETPGASYQDLAFSLKVWLQAKSIKLINEPLLFYRQDNPNSSIYAENKIFCIIDELYEIRDYIKNNPSISKNDISYIDKAAYIICNGHIERLANVHKFAIIMKVSEYYKNWFEEVPLNPSLLEPQEKEMIEQIISRPEQALKRYLDFDDKRVSLESTSLFSINGDVYVDGTILHLRNASSIVIYGSGLVADYVHKISQTFEFEDKIKAFCTSIQESESTFNGFPVLSFDKAYTLFPNALFLVATGDQYQYEILKILYSSGCRQVISMNAELRKCITKNIQSNFIN